MDHKEKDNFDVDIQACSTMDCTGRFLPCPRTRQRRRPMRTSIHMSPRLFHRTRNNGRAAQVKKTEPRP